MSNEKRLDMIEARLAALEGGRDEDGAPKWARPFLNRVPPGARLYLRLHEDGQWVIVFPGNHTLHASGYVGGGWYNDESEVSHLEKYVVPESRSKTIHVVRGESR